MMVEPGSGILQKQSYYPGLTHSRSDLLTVKRYRHCSSAPWATRSEGKYPRGEQHRYRPKS